MILIDKPKDFVSELDDNNIAISETNIVTAHITNF